MSNDAIKNKITGLEAEIKLLKGTIFSKPIDFGADDKAWSAVKPILKKVRSRVYKRSYA